MAEIEIFEEILETTMEGSEAMVEEIEIISDIANASEDVINMGEIEDNAFADATSVTFDELVGGSEELEQSIQREVSGTNEELLKDLRGNGVDEADLPKESGSKLSKVSGEQKAAGDIAKDAEKKVPGCFERLKAKGKVVLLVVEIGMVTEFVGRSLYDTIEAMIDGTKNPPWKGSLTKKDKEQLSFLQDSMTVLTPILKTWKEAIKPLIGNTVTSYGTMEAIIGGRKKEIQVIDVVAYLLMDTKVQLDNLKDTFSKGINNITVIDVTQLSNWVFQIFADVQAMNDLRENKENLVKDDLLDLYKFPPKDDALTVATVLVNDFPQWKQQIENQGVSLAKFGASMAIGAFAKSQVIVKVNRYLMKFVYPRIREAAAAAGKQTASDYVSSQKVEIMALALIPVVGDQKARDYGEKVRKEAIIKAKQAALKAGDKKAEQLKSHIRENIKTYLDKTVLANKANMEQISKYAAEQILACVVPMKPEKREAKL